MGADGGVHMSDHRGKKIVYELSPTFIRPSPVNPFRAISHKITTDRSRWWWPRGARRRIADLERLVAAKDHEIALIVRRMYP
jgi:hypothetical protein